MDTTINPVSGTSQPYAASVPKTPSSDTQVPAPQATPAAQTTTTSPDTTDTYASASEQYQAALRQAALSFKNTYAVSDQEFSIFKDVTGKYITRYVSLRDGKVTYLPEPTLVKQLQLSNAVQSTPRVAISA